MVTKSCSCGHWLSRRLFAGAISALVHIDYATWQNVQYKTRRPVVLADVPDARHTRAWAGGPSRAIPYDPSSGRPVGPSSFSETPLCYVLCYVDFWYDHDASVSFTTPI